MRPPLPTASNPDNFDNDDWPGDVPPGPTHDVPTPAVELRRVSVRHRLLPVLPFEVEREEFELLTRVRYRDEPLGLAITVPANGTFTTDLVSVPALFTWLVPKSGRHLPAALVHDGLVGNNHRDYVTAPPDHYVDRIVADRVFRDAMHDTHVGRIRRWLVWAAVSTVSLCSGGREEWGWAHRIWFGFATLVMLGTVATLGAAATLDLFDWKLGRLFDVPWMHGPDWLEIVQGLSGAVVIPMAVAVLFGKYWHVGAVIGVALATLLHVTVMVLAVTVAYQVAEFVVHKGWVWSVAFVGVLLGSVAVFVAALV